MNFIETEIENLIIVEPKIFGDNRGWFQETYSFNKYKENGIGDTFVQENHSFSEKKGTIRGLHFQINPMAQSKLVRCIKGKILDVAVDLRQNSSSFLKWVSVELSSENQKQFYIPQGFAHGFLTLTDNVEIVYKVNQYYSPEYERSILYNDSELNIAWKAQHPILSNKDRNAIPFKESDFNF